MRYTTILFDYDGTLAHSDAGLHDTVNEVLAKYGYPTMTTAELKAQVGGSFLDLYRIITHDEQKAQEMRADSKIIQFKHLHKYILFPRVHETLTQLHDMGCHLGLITTANKPKVLHLLESQDIARYFQAVVTADDVAYTKPHREPFDAVMQLLSATPASTLMVGDSEPDIAGARGVGIDSVGVTYSTLGEEVKTFHPTYTIDTFTALLPIVKGE